MYVTQHAKDRIQQRGIPALVVDLLIKFGASEPAGGGAYKYFFTKHARRQVKAYAGPLSRMLEGHLDVYAVVGPATEVITVGHRQDRIYRA